MTPRQFTVSADDRGNLRVLDGWFIQAKQDVAIRIGRGAAVMGKHSVLPEADTFLGGNGRNLTVASANTNTLLPVGHYLPAPANVYQAEGWPDATLSTAATAAISDGTDDIAELSGWTTLPVGTYAATTYGRDTYNGGDPFDIEVAAEGGTASDFPVITVTVSAGTAQDGEYSGTAFEAWESDTDGDWTVEVAADGSAELSYLGTAMATRAAGPPDDPRGTYTATATGETDCNGGDTWTAQVSMERASPQDGWVYLQVTEAAGVVTAATGPHFAAALPTASGSDFYYPLARTSGGMVEQIHDGPVIWP